MKASRWGAHTGPLLVVVAVILVIIAVVVWPSPEVSGEETVPSTTAQAPSIGPAGPSIATRPAPYTSTVRATQVAQLAGGDTVACVKWKVCGTDLGIPYTLENGSTGYLFGDTFSTNLPTGIGWRSPVMLRSTTEPGPHTPIVFDSAAGVYGEGYAAEIMPNAHDTTKQSEFTAIPTDGISFPETGEQIITFMSVRNWDMGTWGEWRTNFAGLAYSKDGNHFERIKWPDPTDPTSPSKANPGWMNDADNNDPYQVWSIQRDGQYVYIVSTKAGRQDGPMMLRRVPWDKMIDKNAYECWNGTVWGSVGTCTPLMSGHFGEPSLRHLSDGTWAMAYLNLDKHAIVTRYASSVTGPWSDEKVQVTDQQVVQMYGGFIHPASTPRNLTLIVSQWSAQNYTTLQFNGTL